MPMRSQPRRFEVARQPKAGGKLGAVLPSSLKPCSSLAEASAEAGVVSFEEARRR